MGARPEQTTGQPAQKPVKKPASCHDRALGLLAVRQRSHRELQDRLQRAGFEPEEVADVLTRLEGVGLIDDEAFARAVAEQAFGVRRSGARAVRAALAAKGVAAETTAAVIEELGGDEEDRALDLALSRRSRLRGVAPERAYARLVGLLSRRGYSAGTVHRAVRLALEVDRTDD